MAATIQSPSAVGPVPFKDVVADDTPEPEPAEYEATVAALPSNPKLRRRRYQGTWVREPLVPGVIAIQRGFVPRRGDVVLASPPKCGTTWLKALAFATMARRAYPPSPTRGDHPLVRLNPHGCVKSMERLFAVGCGGVSSTRCRLRGSWLCSVHMQHSILPDSITKNPDCKIVFVEPKDMLVSLWHFLRRPQPDITFSDIFEGACEGCSLSGSIWDHILGYWNASRASPDTVLFLRYEDMLRDPGEHVRKLARFVGQPFSAAEEEAGVVTDIVSLCSFDKQKNLAVNNTGSNAPFAKYIYFRKGMVGDWVNHMTPEMARRLDAIVEDKLRGSGLSFM
ncbi:hypothetical protein EJB05_11362, partial [Eragrostis curvula]